MKLFRKMQAGTNPKQEEVAGSIAGNIIRVQTCVAHYLNGKTKNWSERAKLVLLIVFCILFAALNICLIIYSIHY